MVARGVREGAHTHIALYMQYSGYETSYNYMIWHTNMAYPNAGKSESQPMTIYLCQVSSYNG